MLREPVQFCDDSRLNYVSSRRVFKPGETLDFDDAYRLAHLPLVAPGHPAAIRDAPDQDYRHGTYVKPRCSLVAPVCAESLAASHEFQALERDMRAASFAPKIAWDLCARRASKLHATIVHGLSEDSIVACVLSVQRLFAPLDSISVRLGGPFVGAKNTGRIYFPVYPQVIAGEDAFALIQDAVGAARTRFYVVGYYNLVDPLDAAETADLARFIERWGSVTLAELELTSLVVHETNDDLALSGRPVITVRKSAR
jgi:hypothetical protein